jgi:heptosyltransferase-2
LTSIPTQFIRGLNWLGDAVISLPAVERLIESESSLLSARGAGFSLYRALLTDRCQTLEDARGAKNKIKYLFTLRSLPLKKAMLLQNAFGAALVSFLSGIDQRRGYLRHGRGIFLNEGLKTNPSLLSAHEVFYHLNLLDGQKFFKFPEIGELPNAPSLSQKTLKILEDSPFVLGMAPGASYGNAKKAPLSLFAKAAEIILEERPGQLIILGSDSEKEDAKSLQNLLPKGRNVLNLAGNTTLDLLIELIRRTSLIITNDSGIMHLSGALKTKLIALFGPTNPITTGPLSVSSVILRSLVPCAPCLRRECPLPERICFKGLKAYDISIAARNLLEEKTREQDKRPGIILTDTFPMEEALQRAQQESSQGSKQEILEGMSMFELMEGNSALDRGSYERLADKFKIDLSRSVFVGSNLESLKAASIFGGKCVLSLEKSVPEMLFRSVFTPHVTAPTNDFALLLSKEMLKLL